MQAMSTSVSLRGADGVIADDNMELDVVIFGFITLSDFKGVSDCFETWDTHLTTI